jgi:hypothetical protein
MSPKIRGVLIMIATVCLSAVVFIEFAKTDAWVRAVLFGVVVPLGALWQWWTGVKVGGDSEQRATRLLVLVIMAIGGIGLALRGPGPWP